MGSMSSLRTRAYNSALVVTSLLGTGGLLSGKTVFVITHNSEQLVKPFV